MNSIAYVGIDLHDESLSVCVMDAVSEHPLVRMKVKNDVPEIGRFFSRLAGKYDLRCCYEASSCGYVLQRQLADLHIKCDVIAPSLVPKKPGDKVKTDGRDARMLASLYRAGELTVVRAPSPEDESDRRVTRYREQMVKDVVETKNQLNRLLNGMGRRFPGKSRWTVAYWKWLEQQVFLEPDRFVFTELLGLLKFKIARLQEADRKVAELSRTDKYKEIVGKLCCLRGVGLVTAMILATEIIDFSRFPSARAMMVYLGLVPGESSSGKSRHQGGITKTGNAHCRRVLVEAAWKYMNKPAVAGGLKARQEGQPATVVNHAWNAQKRLNKKFWAVAAHKAKPIAAVATARELVGFIWSIATSPVAAV